MDPSTIKEMLNLKKIYNEVKDGKPVDVKHLEEELDHVKDELYDDKRELASRDHLDIEAKDTHDIDKGMDHLNDIEDLLPTRGKTTKEQDKEIAKSVRDIMQDLAHDPTLRPEDITEEN